MKERGKKIKIWSTSNKERGKKGKESRWNEEQTDDKVGEIKSEWLDQRKKENEHRKTERLRGKQKIKRQPT